MNEILYLVAAVVGIIISAVIYRWIFRVNDHIKNQEIIIDMLGQMLLHQGYTVEEVKAMLEKHKKGN